MAKEDYLIRLSMLENEAGKIEENIGLINQQIAELEVLKLSLEKLGESKEKEILAPVGKGIFLKSEIKDRELFVNIGCGIVIRKKPKEAAEVVQEQIKQLEEIKRSLMDSIGEIKMQFEGLVEEARREEEKKRK